MMKNGQKSSLHEKPAIRAQKFGTTRNSRAEHQRHDPYENRGESQ